MLWNINNSNSAKIIKNIFLDKKKKKKKKKSDQFLAVNLILG